MGANPCRTQSLPCIWFGASRILTLGQPHWLLNKSFAEIGTKFPNSILKIENKIYRS
jgi:hypothetical protein